jgi:hypothetical protein
MDYYCSNCRTVVRNQPEPPIAMRPGCRSLIHTWKPYPGGVTWTYRCVVAGCDVAVQVVRNGEPPDQPPHTEAGDKCARPDGHHHWGAPA